MECIVDPCNSCRWILNTTREKHVSIKTKRTRLNALAARLLASASNRPGHWHAVAAVDAEEPERHKKGDARHLCQNQHGKQVPKAKLRYHKTAHRSKLRRRQLVASTTAEWSRRRSHCTTKLRVAQLSLGPRRRSLCTTKLRVAQLSLGPRRRNHCTTKLRVAQVSLRTTQQQYQATQHQASTEQHHLHQTHQA